MKLDPISAALVVLAPILIAGIAVSSILSFLAYIAEGYRQRKDIEICLAAAREEAK